MIHYKDLVKTNIKQDDLAKETIDSIFNMHIYTERDLNKLCSITQEEYVIINNNVEVISNYLRSFGYMIMTVYNRDTAEAQISFGVHPKEVCVDEINRTGV